MASRACHSNFTRGFNGQLGHSPDRGHALASLIVTDTHGTTRTVEGAAGLSVMEVIRKAGFDDLQALCGGSCSCATCHVVVHPDDFARVGPPSEDETDLLDSSDARTPTSRLSCQIPFGPALDGLRVTVAPEG